MKKIVNNKFIKYLWKVLKIIISIIILSMLTIIITQRVFNNRISFMGYRIFTVASGSMEPKYKVLDMIVAKEINPDQIKVKDDIVYDGKEGTYAGKTITHQVIKIEEKNGKKVFITQGIANPLSDPIVNADQIKGKIVYKLTVFTFINKTLNNNIGFFFLIVVPIGVLLLLEIIDLKEKRERLSNKNE